MSKNCLLPRSGILYAAVCTLMLAGVLSGCQKQATVAVERPPLTVQTVTIEPKDEYRWIEALGVTEGTAEAEVRAQVSGLLQKIAYKEGDRVKKGDTLFEIDPAPYKAALDAMIADRRQVQAQLKQDIREAARYQKLYEAKAVSRKERDDAQSQVDIRKALLASAKANEANARIDLDRTHVKATSDGLVGASEVNVGALVSETSTLLARITQPDNLRIRFTVSERDLAGAKIELTNKVRLRMADGQMYDAALDYVATQMDTTTATRMMRAKINAGEAGVLPGQLVHVQLQTQTLKNVSRVPQHAVYQLPDGTYEVYVAQDGKAVAKPIVVGNWADSDWIVLKGLNAGDKVIVDNIQRLRPGIKVVLKDAATAQSTP
ncbi:MAG: efflux RND transporter periplasmic adaptor subunit [Sutterellaceae bacterium]|nr:efflux RND transporter periplasmic adaptor subunit [Sutterellaceae bacterium]